VAILVPSLRRLDLERARPPDEPDAFLIAQPLLERSA